VITRKKTNPGRQIPYSNTTSVCLIAAVEGARDRLWRGVGHRPLGGRNRKRRSLVEGEHGVRRDVTSGRGHDRAGAERGEDGRVLHLG
jgi:hypothetical protein